MATRRPKSLIFHNLDSLNVEVGLATSSTVISGLAAGKAGTETGQKRGQVLQSHIIVMQDPTPKVTPKLASDRRPGYGRPLRFEPRRRYPGTVHESGQNEEIEQKRQGKEHPGQTGRHVRLRSRR